MHQVQVHPVQHYVDVSYGVQGSSKGTLRLQKPRNGKPFVISNKSLDDIVHSYHHNAAGCKAAAVFFGSIGLAIFGTKVAQYGYFRWKEWRIR